LLRSVVADSFRFFYNNFSGMSNVTRPSLHSEENMQTPKIARTEYRAGILEQSMEARNRVGIGLYYGPAGATWAGGIDSLGSIPVLEF
jgi:hypothetical protein